MSYPEDHPILDPIAEMVDEEGWESVSRQSECVEFYDPTQDQWFKIVVRPIEEPSDG